MKKFKFTLQSLYNYKLTVEKLQKAELKRAQETLQRLLDEEERLENAWRANEISLSEAIAAGKHIPTTLAEHDSYFRYLRDALIEVRIRIEQAIKVVEECQDRLIKTMKEIKTYLKLRDEQYTDWLKELQIEQEKDMGDLVSFKVISEKASAT